MAAFMWGLLLCPTRRAGSHPDPGHAPERRDLNPELGPRCSQGLQVSPEGAGGRFWGAEAGCRYGALHAPGAWHSQPRPEPTVSTASSAPLFADLRGRDSVGSWVWWWGGRGVTFWKRSPGPGSMPDLVVGCSSRLRQTHTRRAEVDTGSRAGSLRRALQSWPRAGPLSGMWQ